MHENCLAVAQAFNLLKRPVDRQTVIVIAQNGTQMAVDPHCETHLDLCMLTEMAVDFIVASQLSIS